jgi:hypothetical protein
MGLSTAFNDSLPEFTDEDLDYLRHLLENSTYDIRQRKYILSRINTETDVVELDRIKQDLWNNNLGIHSAINPGQKEITKFIKKICGKP